MSMREKTIGLLDEIKSLLAEGYTNTEIGRLLYKHPSYIGRIIRQNGLEANRLVREERHISDMHLKLGKILSERRIYQLRKTTAEMARHTKISSTRLFNIESGICNITLTEFLEVCKYYDLDPREVLTRISV